MYQKLIKNTKEQNHHTHNRISIDLVRFAQKHLSFQNDQKCVERIQTKLIRFFQYIRLESPGASFFQYVLT